MTRAGCIRVEISPRTANLVSAWLLAWQPPEPSVLGGTYPAEQVRHLRMLGQKLEKFGRSKMGKRIFEIERSIAETFASTLHPAIGAFRIWPTVVLWLRGDIATALRKRKGRPAHDISSLKRVTAVGFAYADDRQLRRLRKRLRLEEAAALKQRRLDQEFALSARSWLFPRGSEKTP